MLSIRRDAGRSRYDFTPLYRLLDFILIVIVVLEKAQDGSDTAWAETVRWVAD